MKPLFGRDWSKVPPEPVKHTENAMALLEQLPAREEPDLGITEHVGEWDKLYDDILHLQPERARSIDLSKIE